jgi:hypothetical protein
LPIISGGSGSGSGAGRELGYDQITAIASTTEATGTTIIACAAHSFDGAAVVCEFSGLLSTSSVATNHTICLFEGGTEIGRLGATVLAVAAVDFFPLRLSFRFTPTAASHTYTVTAFTNNSTGTQAAIQCGALGTASGPPTYVRFTKA